MLVLGDDIRRDWCLRNMGLGIICTSVGMLPWEHNVNYAQLHLGETASLLYGYGTLKVEKAFSERCINACAGHVVP
jgi:hypothetical protein